MAALRIDRRAQEIHVVHARDLDRVLEGEKQPLARPLFGRHRKEIAAEIGDRALAHLVTVAAGEHRGERALAGAVRPHDRVHLSAVHGKIDTPQDLAAISEPRMQIADLEYWSRGGHEATVSRRCLRGSRRAAFAPRPRIPSAAP